MANDHPSRLFHAVEYEKKDAHAYCKALLQKYAPNIQINTMLEIGGSISRNANQVFNCKEYFNLDLVNNPEIPTIVCDCTKNIPIPAESVDFIFSNDVFEHLEKPWNTAAEITRILRPGGLTFVGTLFAWRYHPVPEDFYRFTPAGLKALFPDLIQLESNFCDSWRRDDMRGFWKTRRDEVPVDMLGGWRENWKVYFFGQKPSN